MIKNVVFDFGNVLVLYSPEYIASQYLEDGEDKRLIVEILFDRLYWDKLDDGSIEDEELVRLASARLPERLRPLARKIYYEWGHHLPAIPGMWELVSRIKREYGVKAYLLSNVGTYFLNFTDEYPIFSEMEKCIFSAAVGHSKPNRDMYEYLTDTCNIRPEQTLFIDDNKQNIIGAEKLGIKGYLFDGNVAALSEYLDKILKNLE